MPLNFKKEHGLRPTTWTVSQLEAVLSDWTWPIRPRGIRSLAPPEGKTVDLCVVGQRSNGRPCERSRSRLACADECGPDKTCANKKRRNQGHNAVKCERPEPTSSADRDCAPEPGDGPQLESGRSQLEATRDRPVWPQRPGHRGKCEAEGA